MFNTVLLGLLLIICEISSLDLSFKKSKDTSTSPSLKALVIYEESFKTAGPEIPKCVNNISPNFSIFFFLSFAETTTSFIATPCKLLTKSSFITSGIKAAYIGVIVCPYFSNIEYIVPSEPVLGKLFPPVVIITLSPNILSP